MAEVRRTPQAETDMEEILQYLNQNNPVVAERLATTFHEKGQALAQFPEMGRLRPEIAPNLRSTLVKPYVSFYPLDGDVVQIVRILHGKRDLRRIMQEESEK
jgi:toxin ParE1/3/4